MTSSGGGDGLEQLQARVNDLEIKVAFQDRTIEALDGVVREFTSRIETLEREFESVRQTLISMQETGPQDVKPPHY